MYRDKILMVSDAFVQPYLIEMMKDVQCLTAAGILWVEQQNGRGTTDAVRQDKIFLHSTSGEEGKQLGRKVQTDIFSFARQFCNGVYPAAVDKQSLSWFERIELALYLNRYIGVECKGKLHLVMPVEIAKAPAKGNGTKLVTPVKLHRERQVVIMVDFVIFVRLHIVLGFVKILIFLKNIIIA